MANFERKTHFVHGFNFKGKRTFDVGEDLLTVHIPEEVTELMDGTPLQFDDSIDDVIVCPDGEAPDLIAYSRVSDELTDAEWILSESIMRDEVKPGDPLTAALYKAGNIIKTRLYTDLTDSDIGSDVEVEDGEFVVEDAGTPVGTVIDVEDGFVYIQLK